MECGFEWIILTLSRRSKGGKGHFEEGCLRFERLKIHRTFIAQMATSPEIKAMIQAIFHIATALNLKTTAEGIEKSFQIGPLPAEGCAEAQAFHFGAAVPAAEVQALLDAPQIRTVS